MNKVLKISSLAVAAVVGGALAASAAVLDFTDSTSYTTQTGALATGSIDGVSWALTPGMGALSFDTPGPVSAGALAGDNDGVGVGDDEITAPGQYITLSFSTTVSVSELFFLDLFQSNDGKDVEVALVYDTPGGSLLESHYAVVPFSEGTGYGAFASSLSGKSFTFFAANTNDEVGAPDYSLAAITFEEIPNVPLPAGALLLGSALAGFGLRRRNRK